MAYDNGVGESGVLVDAVVEGTVDSVRDAVDLAGVVLVHGTAELGVSISASPIFVCVEDNLRS